MNPNYVKVAYIASKLKPNGMEHTGIGTIHHQFFPVDTQAIDLHERANHMTDGDESVQWDYHSVEFYSGEPVLNVIYTEPESRSVLVRGMHYNATRQEMIDNVENINAQRDYASSITGFIYDNHCYSN